ncbi:MAG: nucleotidyltransferase domain-containing protein [Candidatus Woesearchaeota archaeon]
MTQKKPITQTQTDKRTEEKMQQMQKTLNEFKEKALAKFEGYISGIALLPPGQTVTQIIEGEGKELDKDILSVLVLVDDTESTKIPKAELKQKLEENFAQIAKSVDKKIHTQVLIHTELWQYCFDAKTEILQMIAQAAPVYDEGMLAAIKISEVHKQMVLKKFEKYIVSYVLAGSLVQGKANPESDVDVFIVIDDTDVKKMSRVELKDKLRSIIISMSAQASELTGIRKAFNIQTYILTDFWDSIKEANPVIFTFLRDGVPFYDRGVFMPWKQLLQMGKVKPSMEAIDMYMSTGEQMLERMQLKLNELGMEDTFYSILYPSQAALMMYGLAPPTPKETPELLRKVFVKKEKLLEDKYVKILEHNIKVRKGLEHGSQKKVSGKDIDRLLTDAQDFLKRIKKLFTDIQTKQISQSVQYTFDHVLTIIRDICKLKKIKDKVTADSVLKIFTEKIVEKGDLPQRSVRMLEHLCKAQQDHVKGKLHKSEIEKVSIQSQELIRILVEFIQRQKGVELEKLKIKVKHGNTHGEVLLLQKTAFIIHDIQAEEKKISKARITEHNGLENVEDSSIEELEKAIVSMKSSKDIYIQDQIFVDLQKIFGKDVQILLYN